RARRQPAFRPPPGAEHRRTPPAGPRPAVRAFHGTVELRPSDVAATPGPRVRHHLAADPQAAPAISANQLADRSAMVCQTESGRRHESALPGKFFVESCRGRLMGTVARYFPTSSSNSASVSTLTPSSLALSSLLPAFSPATT